MADTPKSIKVDVDLNLPQIRQALEDAERTGYELGLKEGRQDIIEWLKKKYLEAEDRPDRGTPHAVAVLDLAWEAIKHLNGEIKNR